MIVEDAETPTYAQVSQDSDSERPAKVVLKSRKHSIFTHIPKSRDCDGCLKTRMTRGLLAEDALAKLYHVQKSLATCESRNNYWYAVVVQDLATQWIQSYPCTTNSPQETARS